ncbi:MAG: right-handed parallel beta-helix repeat-containing protein [Candidatus Sabulitectum sp.]|nr:right-handed parallel beta-helix repeat-containing protein [Candidatus Sabulitectum sp.]
MTILLSFVLGFTTPVYPGESIQTALDSSTSGDTVLVMPGTHHGNGVSLITITGDHNGIVLLGDSLEPSSVILSGDSLSDSIIDMDCTTGGEIDTTMVISGFTFMEGNASLDAFGGAIHTKHSSPLIQYSGFIQCTADNGGAVYSWKDAPVIRYCNFQSNECLSAGAAIYLYTSNATVSHSTFTDNVSWDDGGAVFCYHSSPAIFNCIFTGGYAHDDGGGIYCYALSHPEISFSTFFDNYSQNTGSAVYFRVNSSPELHHNIVTGNSGPAFYIQDGGEPVFSYNCVWGNPDGNYGNLPDPTGTAGNISANPLLLENFCLSQTAAGQTEESPCVNSGGGIPENYGLDLSWTRTDSVPDSAVVDIGYHHGPDNGWQSNPQGPELNLLRIYPNPASGSVTVILPDNGNFNLLEVYDLSGRKLFTDMLYDRSTEVNLTGQSNHGICLIRVSGESGSLTGRITILGQ